MTLANKLPIPLARSELYLCSNFSKVKSPSSVEGISLKRKYLTLSVPYFSTSLKGSTTFPNVFDIF